MNALPSVILTGVLPGLLSAQEAKPTKPQALPSLYDGEGEVIPPGMGGGAGGKFGGRRGGPKRLRGRAQGVTEAIRNAHSWMLARQSPSGCFDPVRFLQMESGKPRSGNPGEGISPVACTSLCLLSLMADGNTLRSGPRRKPLRRGVRWLRLQRGRDGRFHRRNSAHALAVLALAEAAGLSRAEVLLPEVAAGLATLMKTRHEDNGIADDPRQKTSQVIPSLFAALATRTCMDFRIGGDRPQLNGFKDYLLAQLGKKPNKTPPVFRSNAAAEVRDSAVLLGLFFLGSSPRKEPRMRKRADTLLNHVEELEGKPIDPMLMHLATQGMYQMGSTWWQDWSKLAIQPTLAAQREDGNAKGSWDPVGPGGQMGGRMWCTVLNTLALQSYYRFTRLVR